MREHGDVGEIEKLKQTTCPLHITPWAGEPTQADQMVTWRQGAMREIKKAANRFNIECRDTDLKAALSSQQRPTQGDRTRATVQHHQAPTLGAHLDARGVAAVADGGSARGRHRAPGRHSLHLEAGLLRREINEIRLDAGTSELLVDAIAFRPWEGGA